MQQLKFLKDIVLDNYAWINQYNRIKRHINYINRLIKDIDFDEHELGDLFFDYCIHCFHLRDYMQSVNICMKDTLDFIKENKYLSICWGIADTVKHFKITKKHPYNCHRLYAGPMEQTSTGFYDFPENSTKDIHLNDIYSINIDGIDYDMFVFIENCMKSWDKFIKKNGLKLPE